MHSPLLGNGDSYYVSALSSNRPVESFSQEVQISNYINAHPNLVILVDTFDSSGIIARIQKPQQTVITSDIDFNSVLQNPRGLVNAILIPEPIGVSTLNAINRAYPGIWNGSVSWTKLIVQFPGITHFRLIKVTKQAP